MKRAALVGAVRRGSVMARGRSARTERRCAKVADVAGLAGSEMSKDPLYEGVSVHAR